MHILFYYQPYVHAVSKISTQCVEQQTGCREEDMLPKSLAGRRERSRCRWPGPCQRRHWQHEISFFFSGIFRYFSLMCPNGRSLEKQPVCSFVVLVFYPFYFLVLFALALAGHLCRKLLWLICLLLHNAAAGKLTSCD